MPLAHVILRTLRPGVTFRGRAGRREYATTYLLFLAFVAILKLIRLAPHGTVVAGIAAAGMMVPLLSATVRRLHDTNRSGSQLWILLIPFAGIIVLGWLFEPGGSDPNAYGPAPERPASEPTAAPKLRRRTHLDAEGRVLGVEYVDELGNVTSTTGPV